MITNKIRFVVFLAVISVLYSGSEVVFAEIWQVGQEGLKVLSSQNRDDNYLLEVARIKQLFNAGQAEAAIEGLNKLKKDFPEIVGPDLDVFIRAEVFFSNGKFVKAVRGYDTLLARYPESELYEAAMERQFAIATAFLAGRKKPVLKLFKIRGYAEGIKVMENIADKAGQSPIAIKASASVAESYEKRRKFNEGYEKWSQIHSRWSTGQIGKDSLLGMARCKYAAYRGPDYDISNLISAKTYYQNFKLQYPADADKIDIDKIITQIDQQLAYKHYYIGKYYHQLGDVQSANLYYQMVLDKWPGSTAAKMVKAAKGEEKSSTKKEKKWQKTVFEKLEKLFL